MGWQISIATEQQEIAQAQVKPIPKTKDKDLVISKIEKEKQLPYIGNPNRPGLATALKWNGILRARSNKKQQAGNKKFKKRITQKNRVKKPDAKSQPNKYIQSVIRNPSSSQEAPMYIASASRGSSCQILCSFWAGVSTTLWGGGMEKYGQNCHRKNS